MLDFISGYALYRLPVELAFMDLDTFPFDSDCAPFSAHKLINKIQQYCITQ